MDKARKAYVCEDTPASRNTPEPGFYKIGKKRDQGLSQAVPCGNRKLLFP